MNPDGILGFRIGIPFMPLGPPPNAVILLNPEPISLMAVVLKNILECKGAGAIGLEGCGTCSGFVEAE